MSRRFVNAPIEIREARDTDAEQLIRLIGDTYAEYPNCILDVEREEPDLLGVATAYRKKAGQFWVALRGDRLIGSVGWTPTVAPTRAPQRQVSIELKKLYVEKAFRRQGIAGRLCQLVESAARRHSTGQIEVWSDSRFIEAHSFYESRGYRRSGRTRELFDLSETVEYEFLLQVEAYA